MKITERIEMAIKNSGMTRSAIAKLCGVSPSAVTQWLNADTNAPKADNLLKLARATGVSYTWLIDGKGEMLELNEPSAKYSVEELAPGPEMLSQVPEISWVQAGSFTEICFVDLDPESTNWYPRPPNCGPNTYALKVVGESMLDKYPPGRIIFVDPDVPPESGDDVIAIMTETGEATFKRYIEDPGAGRMLKAVNSALRDPYITINGNCKVQGVVMAQMEMRQR